MPFNAWHCRYASISELGLCSSAAITSAAQDWLSPQERDQLSRFRSPERQRSWVAGRVASKRLLCDAGVVPDVAVSAINIVSRDSAGLGIAPRIEVSGQPLRLALSISHTRQGVMVGTSTHISRPIGVDLVPMQQHSSGFQRMWFSEREQSLMRLPGGRFSPALLWAAKEAAYKVLGDGRPFSPQSLSIQVMSDGRMACEVSDRERTASNLPTHCQVFEWHVDGHAACLATRDAAAPQDVVRSLPEEKAQP